MENRLNEKKRIHLLDEIRGFAVFCMVFYHAFYIIGDTFGISKAMSLFDFFTPVEPFFAALFIAICGVSCSLSHNNLKRGAIIEGVAIGFSLVTCVIMPLVDFEGAEVKFGILHLLGFCVLFYGLLQKRFDKLNPYWVIVFCAVAYPFFSGIENSTLGYGELISLSIPKALYSTDYLMPIGIYSSDFYSADYFPIFPDIFVFFAGVSVGRILKAKGFPDYCYKKIIPFFSFIGRHSLIIYIAHMPVIYFGMFIIYTLFIR